MLLVKLLWRCDDKVGKSRMPQESPRQEGRRGMRISKAILTAAAAATLALAVPSTALAAAGGNTMAAHQAAHAARLAPHTATRPATSLYELELHPRVECGGGDGTLQWGGNGGLADPAYLSYDGNVYNYCTSGRVYMYISYTVGGSPHNDDIGSAGPGQNLKVNYSVESENGTYGDIRVTACTTYNGWRCGDPTGPGA
jgi:hypothetical protein